MKKGKNPIKYVEFSTTDYIKPKVNGGGSNAPLKKVSSEFRDELINSLGVIKEHLAINELDICTAVIELEDNAIAKSHRPTAIFNEQTCPFFGDAGYGKMLIEVKRSGLNKLEQKINTTRSKTGIKALSAVKAITPYTPNISIPKDNNSGGIIVRLFRYSTEELNKEVDLNFEKKLNYFNCKWEKHPSHSVRLYKINTNIESLIEELPDIATVQSAIVSNSIIIKPMTTIGDAPTPADILSPDPTVNYPVVGVVDSAVSQNCKPLNGWLVGQKFTIPDPFRTLDHGTFVSGMVTNNYLYNQDNRFPKCQSKVYSLEVIGNGIGDIYNIVQTMYDVAEERPDIKVWNLSLGTSEPVSQSEISAMALMLDEFQDKYNCLCVIAAGNFCDALRSWPPSQKLNDGVSSPGDSVRGLTVGSIAHIDGTVRNEEPSPFSRKGPVSNYMQKPDLVHFGGNQLSIGGNPIALGVNSICPYGNIRNDIGTSYATPIISTIAANLFQELGDRATPNLVKALLIHNANKTFGSNINDEHRPYYGWGLPQDINDILDVQDHEITIAFEGHTQKSFEVEKLPFPIPDCLRTTDGKVKGEFFITLVYQPELDPNKAFEYCQLDVKVGFGEIDDNGNFTSKVPPKHDSHLYESDLVKNGDKWSPVKVYQKSFPRGVNIEKWRLRIKVLDRDGFEAEGIQIPFTLLLTIRDLDKEQPVYNEMVKLMDAYNWEVSDLIIDHKITVSH